MRAYSLSHLVDQELLRGLASLVAQDRATTACMLAHIAECDDRRLYAPAGYPSMYAYCVGELRLSEDAACKRIQAARLARRFPAIFDALADGLLHLSAVVMLAPYLTPENAGDLLGAAAHRTKPEIEELLARRFPRSETLALVEALPASAPRAGVLSAPGGIEGASGTGLSEVSVDLSAPGRIEPHPMVAPVAPERYLLQLTIGRGTQQKLRHAQDLLGHSLPSGDIAQVLDCALDTLIEKLERQKCAATKRPRRSGRRTSDPRQISADVRRAVWERDGGRCTFVSENGRRCEAMKLLEYDHVEPVARGGRATVEATRLLCRAHNQHAAECAFGTVFMRRRREEARAAAEARRQEAVARAEEQASRKAADEARRKAEETRAHAAAEEVITPLRLLGFRADEARSAAALCENMPEAPLEQRVRRALTYFHPKARTVLPAMTP